MCDPISLTIMAIGAAASSAGSFMQANAQNQAIQAQTKLANQQLAIDMENERIKGLQEANDRQEEYLRNYGSNVVAASAAVNGGQNMSFDQGIAPYNKEVARRDMATTEFNTGMVRSRIASQIKANTYSAKMNRRNNMISAGVDTLGNFASIATSRPESLLKN